MRRRQFMHAAGAVAAFASTGCASIAGKAKPHVVVVGGGYGLVGDIVIGIVGAFLGGWLFRALGVGAPGSGIVSTIIVAFVGACVLLLILRALHRTRYRAT